MLPINGAGMFSANVPVKKRRSRKKKPVAVDPEAERQERELRMKIKQSLHTQHVLRTEVEEDEAQRNVMVRDAQDHTQANMVNQMNHMMGGAASMGFSSMHLQMGGIGMQQHRQQNQQLQQQYQFDTQNQQYDNHRNREDSGMEASIPNMQHQMQQMKQHLIMQRQQLEQELKMKQHLAIEQQMGMQQQQKLQQRQQIQTPFSPQTQQQQVQSPFPPHSPLSQELKMKQHLAIEQQVGMQQQQKLQQRQQIQMPFSPQTPQQQVQSPFPPHSPLSHELKIKQHLVIEQRMDMQQQQKLQQQQQMQMPFSPQNPQQQLQSPFPPQPQRQQSPSPLSQELQQQLQLPPPPQPQRQQLQSPLSIQNGHQELEAKLSSGETMHSLKYQQAEKRTIINNMENVNGPQSSANSSSPQYVPTQYQHDANYYVSQVSGRSSQLQQRDGMNQGNYTGQQNQPLRTSQLPEKSNQQQQQQTSQQFYQLHDGVYCGSCAEQQNQQTNNQTQSFQNQAQQCQSQPYPSQQGAPPHEEQGNGQYNQSAEERSLTPLPHDIKSSPETQHEKSLFSSSSHADSWLNAMSLNSAELFQNSGSLSTSAAFHSVGNMSASFGSTLGSGGVDTPLTFPGYPADKVQVQNKDVSDDVVVASAGELREIERLCNLGDDGKGNDTYSKKSIDEGSSSGSARVNAGQSGKSNEEDAGSVSINKGSPYTDSTVPLQASPLQPIQENESDEASNNGDEMMFGKSSLVMGQSSLMMSLIEGEFMKSNSSMNGANSMNLNEYMMSMDSVTFNALMKQSQSGDTISLVDVNDSNAANPGQATAQKVALTSETNAASGGTPAELGKQDNSNPSENLSIRSNHKDSNTGSSVLSSVSMEDNQQKESNRRRILRGGSSHSCRSRSSGNGSSFAMMSEISQWTMNNPFDNSSSSGTPPANSSATPFAEGGRVSNKQRQRGSKVQADNRVDMGDFRSLGGSVNLGSIDGSVNLSMMSSMTGGEISESLKALDISCRSIDLRKGREA